MANRHTELPPNDEGHRVEHATAKRLATIEDERLHLWFGLDYLPGVNDIDVLIWHEQAGVFVVEVKGVRLPDIAEFGLCRCVINGRQDAAAAGAASDPSAPRIPG